jgi:hypothetical protein
MMKASTLLGTIVSLLPAVLLGCVSATVDEMTFLEPTEGIGSSAVVILGRRDSYKPDTSFEFIGCVAEHIRKGDESVRVMNEIEFLNITYPWFEPRNAPKQVTEWDPYQVDGLLAEKIEDLNLKYIVWIEGSTSEERTPGSSLSCTVGPGGGGCFGFLTWSNTSEYEATIWDTESDSEVGRISADATGQSYMPALVVPVPIVAPVFDTACDSMGDQLLQYFSAHH